MKGHTKAAILLVAVGFVGLTGYKFISPYLQDSAQRQSSDARSTKGSIVIGVDNWIGYFPLCSPDMTKRMRRAGYVFQCEDDKADYTSRMKKLSKGKIDFAVATVDSYILNGVDTRYPGTIVAVLDESKGGDAFVAWQNKLKNLDALKSAKSIRIAFTPGSPSEHLIKSMAVHFDIPQLRERRGDWRVETDGSEDALKQLLDKNTEAAVLWEPDVSRALQQKGIIKILGTEDTSKLIVDILIVGREFSQDSPEAVSTLLGNYFRTLKYYRDNPDELKRDAAKSTGLKEKQVEMMVKGVTWASLIENSQQWFGVNTQGAKTNEGLIDAIDGALQILLNNKDFDQNPIPDQDPYRLTNSQFIADLYNKGINSPQFGSSRVATNLTSNKPTFEAISTKEWNRLREIGTLKIRPILFQSGTAALAQEGMEQLDKAVANLKHYPNFRVMVKGHTGLRGDKKANKKLSQKRAESVGRYLSQHHGIDSNRLRAIGFGSAKPLPRLSGESQRRYNYRLPRVELFLVAENI